MAILRFGHLTKRFGYLTQRFGHLTHALDIGRTLWTSDARFCHLTQRFWSSDATQLKAMSIQVENPLIAAALAQRLAVSRFLQRDNEQGGQSVDSGQSAASEGQSIASEGQNVASEGQSIASEGQNVASEEQSIVASEEQSVATTALEGCQGKTQDDSTASASLTNQHDVSWTHFWGLRIGFDY